MIKLRRPYILVSSGFLAGLSVLLVNDFVLKQIFHNWLTGKLSDLAGLFIFPMFLVLRKVSYCINMLDSCTLQAWQEQHNLSLFPKMNFVL